MKRKMSDAAREHHYAYISQYNKAQTVRKKLAFNSGNAADMAALGWLEQQAQSGSKAAYIKRLVLEDMRRAGAVE